MKKPVYYARLGMLAGILFLRTPSVLVRAQEAADAKKKTTLDNLMEAYNGESNAHARYLAFAQKADDEGYGQAASLFRAAAKAEQVHLRHHAEVIKQLGGTPAANIEAPVVKGTKENLEAAFKGESYEKDTMYPAFIKQAEAEKIAAAVDSFQDARGAEAVHAALYQKVLSGLEAWKKPKKDFYVCPNCGNVVETVSGLPVCQICGTKTKDFIAVS